MNLYRSLIINQPRYKGRGELKMDGWEGRWILEIWVFFPLSMKIMSQRVMQPGLDFYF